MTLNVPAYLLQTGQDRNKQEVIRLAKTEFMKLIKKSYSLEEARGKVREDTGVVL